MVSNSKFKFSIFRTLTYNDEQFHILEKIKMQETMRDLVSIHLWRHIPKSLEIHTGILFRLIYIKRTVTQQLTNSQRFWLIGIKWLRRLIYR